MGQRFHNEKIYKMNINPVTLTLVVHNEFNCLPYSSTLTSVFSLASLLVDSDFLHSLGDLLGVTSVFALDCPVFWLVGICFDDIR